MTLKLADLYPSKYIKSVDLRGQTHALTIERVVVETMPDKKTKPVLYFQGKEKGLVLNKTNAQTIAYDLGEDLDRWIGEKIDIFATRVTGPNGMVDGIRVRPVRKVASVVPRAPATPPAIQPPAAPELNDTIPF